MMLDRIKRSLKTGWRGTFHRRSFIWFLVAASIPGLIIGGGIYRFAVGSIEHDIGELHQRQIAERAHNIDDQLSSLELDLSHSAFNPLFGPYLQDFNFVYYFQHTRDIVKTLLVLQGSHPLIEQVHLFIDRPNPRLFKPEYYRMNDPGLLSDYRRMIKEGRQIQWAHWFPGAKEGETIAERPIVLVHKIPGGTSSPFGVLAVTLNRGKIMNLLKTLTPYNEGATLLLDGDNRILISDQAVKTAFNERLRDEVVGRQDPSGTFLLDSDGVTYSVSYGKLRRISSEWTYISAAPMTAVTAPVITVSRNVIAVSASGLLLAIILSWLASVRVYSPVGQLIEKLTGTQPAVFKSRGMDEFQYLENQWHQLTSESLSLQERMEEQRSHLRSSFFLQLLQGHLTAYSDQDLIQRMKLYGWEANDCQFHIMHIQLTGHDVLTERFAHGDESLVSFAAANIIEELATERFPQFSVINFHDLSVCLLVMTSAAESVGTQLQALGDMITKTINHIIHMQVTITISRPICRIGRVPEAYMEVERATGYRKFVNQNQLLQLERLSDAVGTDESPYPFTLEREVVQAVRMGNKQEAERFVTLFLEEVLRTRGTEIHVQQCMLQLLGAIQHAILQSGINAHQLYNGANLFSALSQIREPDKMLSWLKEKVIDPFIEEREERTNHGLKLLVEQTLEYIHANYRRDISLDACAELVGTSPYTLSKMFRRVTGVNFIDYVTELRIAKAKELLRETDRKINDIAEEVGYQQRYFNRIFKKQVGVTPGQFREQFEA